MDHLTTMPSAVCPGSGRGKKACKSAGGTMSEGVRVLPFDSP
jgi:hypothetical protein